MLGKVHFIGAGPGDPELLTLRGQRLIAEADVILYAGSLVNGDVLASARADVLRYNTASMTLAEQVAVMREATARGQVVARLQSGDPSVYGAITEQMRALEQEGIAYDVTPGVSSAFAAAAALAIEYTVPQSTQTVIITRLAGRTPVPESESLRELAAHRSSLVVFLSINMIARVVEELRAAGYKEDTAVAVVHRVSWPDQSIITGTLADIAPRVEAAGMTTQGLIIVSPSLDRENVALATSSHLYSEERVSTIQREGVAIITLTRHGALTGQKLQASLPGSVLYAPERFSLVTTDGNDGRRTVAYSAPVGVVLQNAFKEHRALVCVMASGLVVRELAPMLRSKHVDPAVVVLDERGKYAVSLIGGHRGGANALARQVAALLGGTAVISTASDVQGLPALDLLGQEEGWILRGNEHMTAAIAALVNGDPVGIFQDAGSEDWWPADPPDHLRRYRSLAELAEAAPPAALAITCREIPPRLHERVPAVVVYRPRCLAVGVGCNRGTAAAEILAAVDQTLAEAGFSPQSVFCLATVEAKRAEEGIKKAASMRGWPLTIVAHADVAALGELPNPSPWAERELGIPGVAEPSALLVARPGTLLVEKRKFANVTVAIAQRLAPGRRASEDGR